MANYYDGTKLLSLKDCNGNVPEIYICTTNRTGGKTTYFGRLVVKRFLEGKGKFVILYRFKYELKDCADAFFKDIGALFFPEYNMRSEPRREGTFHELFLYKKKETDTKKPGISCGYAVPINSADQVKKISHMFSDVQRILFDEFQSETFNYCTDEVNKFISIHTSIARGQGKQSRYVPVFMISNFVTLLNPYYVEMGISTRLQSNTKFFKGEGFVLEQGWVNSAAEALQNSGFMKAFSNSKQHDYLTQQGVYLMDSSCFIEKATGNNRYIATLRYKGKEFALRAYYDNGFIYCDDNPDKSFPVKLSITTEDHDVNYVMLRSNVEFLSKLRFYFDKGCFRFKNLLCKEALMKALSY